MSAWLPDLANHRLQLGITAVVSGCIAVTAVLSLQEARKWYNEHELKESIPDLDQPHDVERVSSTRMYDEETKLIENRSMSSAALSQMRRKIRARSKEVLL
jgi:hypothetical protein